MIEEAKYKQKTLPNIDKDSVLVSSYFSEYERLRIKEVFQNYHHMDIETLAMHDKTLNSIFTKIGIIREPYVIDTPSGKALVLDQNDSYYRVRMLDWTEETIKQMGGLNEAWIVLSKDQIIKE